MALMNTVKGIARKLSSRFSSVGVVKQPFFLSQNSLMNDWENQIAIFKTKAFIHELQRYLGSSDYDAAYLGHLTGRFRKPMNRKSRAEARSLAEIFLCIDNVDELGDFIGKALSIRRSKLYRTDHVLTCWSKTPQTQRLSEPEPGCLIIYAHYRDNTMTGSADVEGVLDVLKDTHEVWCVGFGSAAALGVIEQVGQRDATVNKRNYLLNTGPLRVHGFLKIW